MNISSLHREFRQYALAERGLRTRTLADILAVVRRLSAFCGTEDVTALPTSAIRGFLQTGRIDQGWAARTLRLYRQYFKNRSLKLRTTNYAKKKGRARRPSPSSTVAPSARAGNKLA